VLYHTFAILTNCVVRKKTHHIVRRPGAIQHPGMTTRQRFDIAGYNDSMGSGARICSCQS